MIEIFAATMLMQGEPNPANEFAAPNWVSEDARAEVAPYYNCVVTRSVNLEASGESPDLVVEAAIRACKKERLELWAAIELDAIMTGQATNRNANEIVDRFDRTVRSQAILEIIESRASRKRASQ